MNKTCTIGFFVAIACFTTAFGMEFIQHQKTKAELEATQIRLLEETDKHLDTLEKWKADLNRWEADLDQWKAAWMAWGTSFAVTWCTHTWSLSL